MFMTTRNALVTVLLAAACVIALALFLRNGRKSLPTNKSPTADRSTGTASTGFGPWKGGDATSDADHVAGIVAGLDSPEVVARAATSRAHETAIAVPSSTVMPNTVDLAYLFVVMPGAIDVSRIVGNSDINPTHREPSAELTSDLQYVIDYYKPRLAPLTDKWLCQRQTDMIAAVEAGKVAPSEPVYPTPENAAGMVRAMYPSMPREQQRALAEKVQAMPTGHGSYMRHGGSIYEVASFAELPASDEMFGIIQSAGLEFMACVLSVLEHHRFLSPAVAARLIESGSVISARSARR